MERSIKQVAVLGAGVMGAAIAAHLANAGVSVLLLDIAPTELTPEELAKGLTLESKAVRSRIARAGLEAAKKSKPASFFAPELAARVRVGNLTDDLPQLASCDWIIEAVVENLAIKQQLWQRVAEHRRADAIVSSNTSGISIRAMSEQCSPEFRRHFLGTHFFNPPRYMRLLELIPTPETDPAITAFIADYADRVLGKGIVYAKDTPNFIANRIGTFAALHGISVMQQQGLTIEEVDKITGPAIGHPKTASFRTADLVGLDTFAHVANNLYESTPDDEQREVFRLPDFIQQMVGRRMLGNKTKGGFYKKARNAEGKDEIYTLDYVTLDYRPKAKVNLPALEMTKSIDSTAERIKALTFGKDRVSQFLWETTSALLIYTANRLPEIADDIVQIDNAMKWGYNWELGPFEVWDALGVEATVTRMKAEQKTIPPLVARMLEGGHKSFYKKENGQTFYYDLLKGEYRAIEPTPGVIILAALKDRKQVIQKNAGASLIDLGDGVACVEFHSKMNTLGDDTIQMLNFALKEVAKNFDGLVIGNQGENFSAGVNLMLLLLEAQEQNWEEIDLAIRTFQNTTMALRYSPKPVVVAPFGLTLAGGCEIALHGDRVRAAAETYMGLVEIGVGLIPGAGGTKEMVARATAGLAKDADPFPAIKQVFETIAMAKVSTSAVEARQLGYLRSTDQITMNRARLIADAKETVLAMVRAGYEAPTPRQDIPALGEAALATLKLGIYLMKQGGYISEYDAYLGGQLARIMTGGDLSHPTLVSEQHLLDLEREVFLRLCGQRKTLERIQHTLKTGKPLRN